MKPDKIEEKKVTTEFDRFKARFVKENRILCSVIAGSLVLFTLTLFIVNALKFRFYAKNSEIFEERMVATTVCREGMLSIFSSKPNGDLITSGLLKLLEKEPYALKVDSILRLKSLEENFCSIIIKSEGKVLGLKIGLTSSEENPFYYKIISIDEFKPNGDEL